MVSKKVLTFTSSEKHTTTITIKIQIIMATSTASQTNTLNRKIEKNEKMIRFHEAKIRSNENDRLAFRLEKIEGYKRENKYYNEVITRIESDVKNSKGLVSLLMEQLQDLKISYIQKTVEWAKGEAKRNIERRDDFKKNSRELHAKNRNEYWETEKWVYQTPAWKFDPILFAEKAGPMAAEHFDFSIQKLAMRVLKKGLDEKLVTVSNSSVGVNISATITDGTQTVNAFTIVAHGPIQRPHYRFLTK